MFLSEDPRPLGLKWRYSVISLRDAVILSARSEGFLRRANQLRAGLLGFAGECTGDLVARPRMLVSIETFEKN